MKQTHFSTLTSLTLALLALPVYSDPVTDFVDRKVAGELVVFQDNFETGSNGHLPAGWSPWGNQDHNTPADFVSDRKAPPQRNELPSRPSSRQ